MMMMMTRCVLIAIMGATLAHGAADDAACVPGMGTAVVTYDVGDLRMVCKETTTNRNGRVMTTLHRDVAGCYVSSKRVYVAVNTKVNRNNCVHKCELTSNGQAKYGMRCDGGIPGGKHAITAHCIDRGLEVDLAQGATGTANNGQVYSCGIDALSRRLPWLTKIGTPPPSKFVAASGPICHNRMKDGREVKVNPGEFAYAHPDGTGAQYKCVRCDTCHKCTQESEMCLTHVGYAPPTK